MTFRHCGYGPADSRGAWVGRLELADLTDEKPAVIEANLLDDLVPYHRCTQRKELVARRRMIGAI